MVYVFLVMTTSLYSHGLDFTAAWLSSTVAVALHTDRRWATWVFAHGIARASVSISFITLTTWLIMGVPRMTGTHATKFDKSGTTRAIWSLL